MRRFSSVILSTFLGAIAVGGGMFIFLKKANDDRARLAELVTRSQSDAAAAQERSQHAIAEANQSVAAANAEIAKTQKVISALQEERDLLRKATLLVPRASAIRGWKQAINVPLGISCKLPPTSFIEQNDAEALIFSATQSSIAPSSDARWMSMTPFDEQRDEELRTHLTNTTTVSYLVNGHLLIGLRGSLPNSPNGLFVLRVRKDGRTSYLIWAKVPPGGTDAIVLAALATLEFAE